MKKDEIIGCLEGIKSTLLIQKKIVEEFRNFFQNCVDEVLILKERLTEANDIKDEEINRREFEKLKEDLF